MKRKQALNFFDISSNIRDLPKNELLTLKGGYSDIAWWDEIDNVDVYPPDNSDPWGGNDDFPWGGNDPWDDDSYDKDYWENIGGGGGGSSSGGWPWGSGSSNQITTEQDLSKAGYWSVIDGKLAWTINGGEIPAVTVTANKTPQTAIGVMLSSLGLASDHASVAAAVMKLETKGFNLTSKSFGILGVTQNVVQMWKNDDWNWRDTGQAALGAALMIPGLNGAIVVGGGAILFGWELYELMNEK